MIATPKIALSAMPKDRASSGSSRSSRSSRSSTSLLSKINHPLPGSIDYGAILRSHDADGIADLDETDIETPTTTASSTASVTGGSASKCSVSETCSNLIALVTGAGMLSLPAAASYSGWAAALILVGVAFIFMYTFSLLAEAIEALVVRMRVGGLGSNMSLVASSSPMKPNAKVPVHLMVHSPEQDSHMGSSFSETDLASKIIDGDSATALSEKTSTVHLNRTAFVEKIDYVILARASLGRGSEKFILLLLFLELTAALVSFIINIGTNIELLGIGIDITSGILLTSAVSCYLSSLNMRNMAMSSLVGLMLTSLTLVSLILSGYQTLYAPRQGSGIDLSSYREFKTAEVSYAPLSLFIGTR